MVDDIRLLLWTWCLSRMKVFPACCVNIIGPLMIGSIGSPPIGDMGLFLCIFCALLVMLCRSVSFLFAVAGLVLKGGDVYCCAFFFLCILPLCFSVFCLADDNIIYCFCSLGNEPNETFKFVLER
jgi:hypothetical protein